MTWPNLLASRLASRQRENYKQTEREESTQEGDERQDGVERGSKGGMRQRRSSCGCTVNHDEVKDEMRGTRNTGGEKIYNARRRREVGRLECLIFESRYTSPPQSITVISSRGVRAALYVNAFTDEMLLVFLLSISHIRNLCPELIIQLAVETPPAYAGGFIVSRPFLCPRICVRVDYQYYYYYYYV